MSRSIMQKDKVCYISGRTDFLEKHHIFGGAYRDKSEHYGLWVYLNHFYHNEPPCPQNANLGSAHFTREISEYLKKKGQKEAMKEYGWTVDKFREIFGKSWF